MKKPVVFTLHSEEDRSAYETVVRRLGCEVRAFSRPRDFADALEGKTHPDLLIVDRHRLPGIDSFLGEKNILQPEAGDRPLLVVSGEGDAQEACVPAHASLPEPFDLETLHKLLCRQKPCSWTREHPRLEVCLPGVFFQGKVSYLCNILSLGTGGAFVKTAWRGFAEEDRFDLVVPLLGLKREIEVTGRIVYRTAPGPENNYLEGVGIRFARPEAETLQVLREYLRFTLRQEVASVGDEGPGRFAGTSGGSRSSSTSRGKSRRISLRT